MTSIQNQPVTINAHTWTFTESDLWGEGESWQLDISLQNELEAFGLKTQVYTRSAPHEVTIYPRNQDDSRDTVVLREDETLVLMGYREPFFKLSDRS